MKNSCGKRLARLAIQSEGDNHSGGYCIYLRFLLETSHKTKCSNIQEEQVTVLCFCQLWNYFQNDCGFDSG